MKHNSCIILSLTLLAAASTACSDDSATADEPQPAAAAPICFSYSTEAMSNPDDADGGSTSRGTSMGFEDIENFKVYAAQWEGNDQWNSEFSFYIMDGETVGRAKDGSWTTSVPYYWPDSGRLLSFFAITPDNPSFIFTNHTEAPDKARFFFAPPNNPAEQGEILFAGITERINYNTQPQRKVELHFQHILARVIFNIRGDARRIESITLSNVTGCGGFHPTFGNGWWDLYNYENNSEGFRTAYTVHIPEDGSMGDDQALMIIPQTTPGECALEVRFRDGTYRTAPFPYKTFNAGGITNINISI